MQEGEGSKSSIKFIKDNKTSIGLVLMSVSCASLVASVWRRTRKTNDFGWKKIVENPALQGNIQHASWLWAIQAFGISTAIVGVGFGGLALGLGHYMNVSSLKEFSIELRHRIHRRFPSLQVPISEKEEEEATREFMIEWKGVLENELEEDARIPLKRTKSDPDQDHRQVISSIIAEGLGPLGKYTRGGSQDSD